MEMDGGGVKARLPVHRRWYGKAREVTSREHAKKSSQMTFVGRKFRKWECDGELMWLPRLSMGAGVVVEEEMGW